MARADRDRWDLATSVGATATMVAAQRALASDAQFIDDPYAAPLVRAVGIDVYVRLVNGEIPVGGDSPFDPHRMAEGMACRTRFYDQFFLDAARSNITALSAVGSRLAFEFVPETTVFADPRWRAHHDRMSELGFEIDFNDLVYHSQRSHIVEHLSRRGWQASSHTVAELHAANGFHYPDDDIAKAFADVTYSSAVLGR